MPARSVDIQKTIRLKRGLNSICKQAELVLLIRYYQKIKDYARYKQHQTHLKRCAVLLKHQDIKRTVTSHFLRWLSNTQRQTSIRAGQHILTKVVVLPRNQDFINLGIKYLLRWRLWLRRLRQRKCRNVILLLNKTEEQMMHQVFYSWGCFLLKQQRDRLEIKVHDLEEHNNELSNQISNLENELQKKDNIIDELNNDAEKFREQIAVQQQEIEDLRNVMKAVSEKLEKPNSRKTNLQGQQHTAEESLSSAAHHSDNESLQLLNDCESLVTALEKLRNTLPPEKQQLEGFEDVIDAACEDSKRISEDLQVRDHEVDLLRSTLYEVVDTFTGDPILSTTTSAGGSKEEMSPNQSLSLSDMACKAALERCPEAKKAAASLNKLLGTKAIETDSIMKLVKPIIEKLQDFEIRMASKGQEISHLRTAAEESLKLLTKLKPPHITSDPAEREERKRMLIIRRAAEEASQHGDDLPLRMLSECEAASKAMGKLRKSFLDNVSNQDEITNIQTLADAICHELSRMNKTVSKKQQEVEVLRAAAEESLKTLDNPQRSSTTSLNPVPREERKKTFAVRRAVEEAEQQGDSLPLRLLSNCEASAKAFQKLRNILPDDVEHQEEIMGPQAIADAICQQTKTLREDLLKEDDELRKLRASDEEKGRLLSEVQSHDERWEPSLTHPEETTKSHHTKQFDGTEWKDVIDHKPAELERSFITDAANACHVDPDSLTNIRMSAEGSPLLVEFEVQHDSSVSTEELTRRINEFPFRTVRRMYDRRSAPKEGMDMLQEQLKQKEQEVEALHLTIEAAIEKLEKPNSKETINLHGMHAAEEAAHRGDNKPLQLLKDCESIETSVEKLRNLLPLEKQKLVRFEEVLEAAGTHVGEIGIFVRELNEEFSSAKSQAIFLRDFIKEGAERMMMLAHHENMSEPPSLRNTAEGIQHPLLNWSSKDTSSKDTLPNTLVGKNSMELVREEQLLQEERLDTDGPLTASVLQSFQDALTQLYETVMKCEDLYVEQQETVEKEGEKASVLASAAEDAVKVLRSWSSEFKENLKIEGKEKGSEVNSLAVDLRQESIIAAQALSQLRSILNTETLALSRSIKGGAFDSHNDKIVVEQKPNIMTYDDLVNTVKCLQDRLKEVGEAYDNIYMEFRRYVPDSPLVSGINNSSSASFSNSSTNSRRVTFAEPHKDGKEDLVKKAELVVRAVRDHIQNKGKEVKVLRGVMRKGIEALGGSSDDLDTDDESIEDEKSAAKTAAIGSKFGLLCQETGNAIKDAKEVLGIPAEGKLKLSDMIPNLKEKMHELEHVKTESEVLVKEVRNVLGSNPSQQSANFLRSLKPKRKPMALSVSMEEPTRSITRSISIESTEMEPSFASQHSMKPGDLIKELRKEIYKKSGEINDLRDASGIIISLLDGTYTSDSEPPHYGEMLVPLLITQAEDLKRSRKQVENVLSEDVCKSSVGNQLMVLASQLESLRIGNTALKDELDQRTKQSSHLVKDFTKECSQLKELNAEMQKKLDNMQEESNKREEVQRLWAKRVVELMSLRMVKEDLRRWFFLWLGHTAVMRGTAVRGAADVEKQLSIEIVRKQHDVNILANALATVLQALPGVVHPLSISSMELICMAETDGEGLDAFIQKCIQTTQAWIHDVSTLIPTAMNALRTDTEALRQSLHTAWNEQLAVVYRPLLTEAFKKLTVTDEKDRELEFLRKRVKDREAFARANKELAGEIVDIRDQLAQAQGHIGVQNDKIDKLQQENRDLHLNIVMQKNVYGNNSTNNKNNNNDNHNNNNISGVLNNHPGHLREKIDTEEAMIAGAKRLALEAINAISGKDLAICIGEVAELTLDMYRRTITALADICNAQHNSANMFSELIQLRLQELQALHDVRNDIVARLPELLRIPYIC